MLGAPIIGREVRVNSDGGAAGSIGFPCKEISPGVTRVAAVIELVLPCRSMAVLPTEFAAAEHSGMSIPERSLIATSLPLVPSARMQGFSSTSITATDLVAILTPERNIDARKVPCVCSKATATPLLTRLSLYG